ncbi:lysyl oxidase family protein [Paenibacillus durus]|uniref:lysyl oxidase family protein n=1 Tax=Paenibacillus durus TaxID=44251 RepID=UPI0006934ED5|nr:lysyl oxidase family protein [Paenibacillus durus]
MGANLVPIVRNFSIHTETFAVNDHSIQDGCVTPGTHRVMRFDFLSHNIGDADLVVGAPADHPEWFVYSGAHGHYHLKDFNEFILLDRWGNQVTSGYKQAFCLIDVEHRSAWGPAQARFRDCNTNQGISAGWADLYNKSLACQFIVLDGVPDGDYTLVSTTNARRIIPEDTYADNTIYTGLRISGNSVTEISLSQAVWQPAWSPTAIARSTGHLDLFVMGNDGRVYTSWWHEGSDWSGINDNWRSIGGFFPVGAPVSTVARRPGILDLFVVGNDGRVYTSWWVEGTDWSGINDNWRSIGGFFPVGAPVSAVARRPGILDLFVTGNDGRVYTSWWVEGTDWSGINDNWRPIGGFFPVGAPVSAVARRPNILDLFVTGNDGRVYTSWWVEGADWSGINDNWRSIGGFFPVGAPVSAVARRSGILDLFVVGNDGRVYTSWWVEGTDWSGINDNWRSIGGFFPVGAPVSAVARRSGILDLFVVGNDGRVYTSWWVEGMDWSGINDNWRSIGGFFPVGAPVRAVSRRPDILDLFVVGNDGRVYTSWWVEGTDWSGINDNWRPIGGFFPVGSSRRLISV